MLYEFRWEDLFTGEIRRTLRAAGQDHSQFVEFQLPDLAPTENLRILILDNAEHGRLVGEILLKR
jgi:hypothetical protein